MALALALAPVARCGGPPEAELHTMTIPRPRLRMSAAPGNPVLAGALEYALGATRGEPLGAALTP